jgi:NAD(P)-dependent dehydrogenase (short-subunit alcohol dehydrogenase family)
MIGFSDRVVLVTGAGGGLGRCHALGFAARGAAVVVNDLGGTVTGEGAGAGPADAVVDEIRATGGVAVADTSSVSTPEGGAAMVARAIDEFGRIDVVVNNAGILRDRSFAKLEWSDLDAVLDVHLRGAFYVSRPAFRRMREQEYGRIIVTTSATGLFGNFGQANYAAAKLALVGLMNVLKHEGAKYGITANAVAPLARTRMTEDVLGELADHFDPEAVTPAVLYLASEACELSGEIWSVGAGAVSRAFVGLTPGWFKHPDEGGPPTPEELEANLEAIRSVDEFTIPGALGDDLLRIGRMLEA